MKNSALKSRVEHSEQDVDEHYPFEIQLQEYVKGWVRL